jgi:hypothetical protein
MAKSSPVNRFRVKYTEPNAPLLMGFRNSKSRMLGILRGIVGAALNDPRDAIETGDAARSEV